MPNRLQHENSPYLLQHADNPVDWFPWGDDAFQDARQRDAPIFLSIGYAACHWCHVMEHESFEDPTVAQFLNQHFVSIKVDREERPDVDSIYMQAVTAITGRGGWPLTAFLTPDREPFYGGTYFPPQRRYNMPSFMEVLEFIHQRWQEDRQSLLQSGRELTEHVRRPLDLTSSNAQISPEILATSADSLWKSYDWKNGGWGPAPKFPSASTIEFLLSKYVRDHDQLALDMVEHALAHMADGGLYDQLKGGFHRYSVDEKWLVPHFEKMLYDNALLGTAYIHAWQASGYPRFEQVARQTLNWLLSEMRSPAGGFFASLDADSEGEEGKYYVWNWSEVEDILGDDFTKRLFTQAYGVSQEGNFEGSNILYRARSLEDLAQDFEMTQTEVDQSLAEATDKLSEARDRRVRPATDDKVITSWNGLMLTLLAEASRLLDRETYLPTAQKLGNFLVSEMMDNGRLYRTWRKKRTDHPGMLEDYGAIANGLIDLYQVDFDGSWIEIAETLMKTILEQFDDPQGGFYDAPADQTDLIARPKSLQDSPIPSGNSLALRALLRLNSLTPQLRWEEKAIRALAALQSTMERFPSAFSAWLLNLDWALGPVLQLAIIGDRHDQAFHQLAMVGDEFYHPRIIRAGGLATENPDISLLEGRQPLKGQPRAYLCQEYTCRLPTTEPDQLRQQISDAIA